MAYSLLSYPFQKCNNNSYDFLQSYAHEQKSNPKRKHNLVGKRLKITETESLQ